MNRGSLKKVAEVVIVVEGEARAISCTEAVQLIKDSTVKSLDDVAYQSLIAHIDICHRCGNRFMLAHS